MIPDPFADCPPPDDELIERLIKAEVDNDIIAQTVIVAELNARGINLPVSLN